MCYKMCYKICYESYKTNQKKKIINFKFIIDLFILHYDNM